MTVEFALRRLPSGVRYRVYVPPQYDAATAWPAVLFLHGAGERGSDGRLQTTVGLGPTLGRRSDPYPAVVVFPQCPRDNHWTGSARKVAMMALAEIEAELTIDPQRIALTGNSMGGAGAWLLASENPGRFSRLAPICGWIATRDYGGFASRLKTIPTWVFHGSTDPIVPAEESRVIVAAMKRIGADVRYDELNGVGHNSWDPAYDDTDLLDWMIGVIPSREAGEGSPDTRDPSLRSG